MVYAVALKVSVLKKCVSPYHTLMVKPLYTLALRALRVNQELGAQLTRIQYGFLPEKSIQQTQHTILELQEMLAEMQRALKAPPSNKPFIPLK
jgi:hypothetical protein